MEILLYNARWMFFNIWLAVLPVILLWLVFKVNNRFFKIVFGLLWFIYLPNTLYILTDLIHLPQQWVRLEDSDRVFLLMQYVILEILGFVTFLLALAPLEKFLFNSKKWRKEKKLSYAIFIVINMMIGFGIVFGRTARVNSWEVFTSPSKVFDAILAVFSSIELLLLAILLGLFANFFYFLFRKPFIKFAKVMKNN